MQVTFTGGQNAGGLGPAYLALMRMLSRGAASQGDPQMSPQAAAALNALPPSSGPPSGAMPPDPAEAAFASMYGNANQANPNIPPQGPPMPSAMPPMPPMPMPSAAAMQIPNQRLSNLGRYNLLR